MQKLLKLLLKGPRSVRIGSYVSSQISDRLLSYCQYFPPEIARKPCSLSKVNYYKATEFRSFLLYTGMMCLKGSIDENIYKNFLYYVSLQCQG